MSSYVSPYGFAPIVDAMLDVIADRRDMDIHDLADLIHRNAPTSDVLRGEGIYDWLDLYAWDQLIGPAIDTIERRIFPEDA